MDKRDKAMSKEATITTTIGELICAIADAAREASIEENEVGHITQMILADVLRRYENGI